MKADLHIHTTASDGRYDPLKIVQEATDAGLKVIAITDHDTIDGLLTIREAGLLKNSGGLSIIPGIELNADFPGHEVHILGYFISLDNAEFKTQLNFFKESRLKRAELMVEKLNSLGYSINYTRIIELAGASAIVNRPHIAKALVEKGYFKKLRDALDTILSQNSPAYIPQYKIPLEKVIEIIKSVGGMAVLAHPRLVGNDDLVNDIVKTPGISGLEVFHPIHNQDEIKKYLALAEKYNLKVTGGSDFHAMPGRFPEQLGIFTISADLADQLKTALP